MAFAQLTADDSLNVSEVAKGIINGRLPSRYACAVLGVFVFLLYASNGDFLACVFSIYLY